MRTNKEIIQAAIACLEDITCPSEDGARYNSYMGHVDLNSVAAVQAVIDDLEALLAD